MFLTVNIGMVAPKPAPRQRGFSLIELMIAITLGLLILAGLTTVFVQNSAARNEIERANQQTENGRYAIALITDDLRNAGYLAEYNPALLSTAIKSPPNAVPDPCSTSLASLLAALPVAVQGYDNGTGISTTCGTVLSDRKPNTDILVVRRASTCALGDAGCDALVTGAPYFQASACSSGTELTSASPADSYRFDTNIANLDRHANNCTTVAPQHQYRVHIYYIANNDKTGDGIPTLVRAELGANGFSIVPLVEGIEDLQIEYGLDNPAAPTGSPTTFVTTADGYNLCSATTTPTCAGYWANVVSAKVRVLARGLSGSPGYSTTKTYSMGLLAAADGPFADTYKRHVFESVVRLNNVAGRNTP